MSLQAVVELIDKMSGPLGQINGVINQFSSNVANATTQQANLQKSADNAVGSQNKLAESVKSVGKALAGLAIVNTIFQGFTASITSADKLDDLSEKLGISAAKLNDLKYIANLSGNSLEGLSQAYVKLTQSIGKTQNLTSEQSSAFNALGISAKDANGKLKSTDEIFGLVAEKFSTFADTPEKTAIGVALFGEQFQQLLPLLNRGKDGIEDMRLEMEQLGALKPEQFDAFAGSSAELFDNFDKLATIVNNLYTRIASELVPILRDLVTELVNSYKEGGLLKDVLTLIGDIFENTVIPVVRYSTIIVRGFADSLTTVGKATAAVAASLKMVTEGDLDGASAVWSAFRDDIERLAQANVEFRDKILASGNATDVANRKIAGLNDTVKQVAPEMKKAGDAAKSELQAMLTSLNETGLSLRFEEADIQVLQSQAKYMKDIAAGIPKDEAKGIYEQVLARIEANRVLKEQKKNTEDQIKAEAEQRKEFEEFTKKRQENFETVYKTNQEIDRGTDLMEYEATLVGKSTEERAKLVQQFKDERAFRESLIGLTDEQIKQLTDERNVILERRKAGEESARIAKADADIISKSEGKITEEVQFRVDRIKRAYASGQISLADYTNQIKEQLGKLSAETEDTANKLSEFWTDVAKNIQSSMSSFFFDIMQGKLDDLAGNFKKMIDRMIADALAAKLADALFGEGFGKTGKLSGYLGQGLSFLQGLFGGARANGGPVESNKMYLVGENGPEAFIPRTSGMILPNSSIRAASPANNVNINITAMDSQDVRRALERDNKWISDLVNKSTRAYNLGV